MLVASHPARRNRPLKVFLGLDRYALRPVIVQVARAGNRYFSGVAGWQRMFGDRLVLVREGLATEKLTFRQDYSMADNVVGLAHRVRRFNRQLATGDRYLWNGAPLLSPNVPGHLP